MNKHFTDENGNCDGGVSTGVGFTISWQRGAIVPDGQNGAFPVEVLRAVLSRLEYYQSGKFACDENAQAVEKIKGAIADLESRLKRRHDEGKLGTFEV